MELDYSLTTPQERVEYVKKLLADNPPLNNSTLTILADYILFIRDRNQTKKEREAEHPILTPNREFTIDKRQTSYEGLVDKLENGEDGIYNIIRNDKTQILDPKDPITEEDIKNIPGIKDCMDVILSLKKQLETAQKQKELEEVKIPHLDYDKVPHLALEARQKLQKVQPANIGQASRISGVNPSDISVLLIYLKQEKLY